MSLQFEHQITNDNARLSVVGEVDVSNADELSQALQEVLEAKPARIEVNLSKVPYIDSTGIGVLVAASKQAEEQGGVLSLGEPQPNVMRVLSMLGVISEFNLDE